MDYGKSNFGVTGIKRTCELSNCIGPITPNFHNEESEVLLGINSVLTINPSSLKRRCIDNEIPCTPRDAWAPGPDILARRLCFEYKQQFLAEDEGLVESIYNDSVQSERAKGDEFACVDSNCEAEKVEELGAILGMESRMNADKFKECVACFDKDPKFKARITDAINAMKFKYETKQVRGAVPVMKSKSKANSESGCKGDRVGGLAAIPGMEPDRESHKIEESIENSKAECDSPISPLSLRVNEISKTCPGAPMKKTRERFYRILHCSSVCRKLEF